MKDELHNPTSNAPANASDPRFDSLLDEALGPESVKGFIPADLTDRVFEATRRRLAPPRRSVLAKIGPARWNAIAAAIMLAAGAGVWFAANNLGQHSVPGIGRGSEAMNTQPLMPESQAWPGESVDQDLAALAIRVEGSQRGWQTSPAFDSVGDDADAPDVSNSSSVF